jgi:hypothetical protein
MGNYRIRLTEYGNRRQVDSRSTSVATHQAWSAGRRAYRPVGAATCGCIGW